MPTTRTTTGTAADAQTQIGLSSSGDTVQWPLNGSVTWASGDHITLTGKYIILDGNGCTINGTGATVGFQLETTAGGSLRVTGFTFLPNASGWGASNGIIQIGFNGGSGTFANPTPRIDNNTFTQGAAGVGGTFISCYFCWPLIDHNKFTADDAAEMVHNFGWFAGNSTGWSQTITPGSAAATYLEDNDFEKLTQTSASNAGAGAFQSYSGSRLVARRNTFGYLQTDVHGTAGQVWCRWWEIYSNNWVMPSGSHNLQIQFDCRGGSGVFFGNTHSGGTNSGNAYVQLRVESAAAYPAPYQIGRGKSSNVSTPWDTNQALDPAYFWNNVLVGTLSNQSPTYLTDGVDYYSSTQKPGYSPYKYPFLGAYPSNVKILPSGTQMEVDWDVATQVGAGGGNGFTLSPSGGACTAAYNAGLSSSTVSIFDLSRPVLSSETFATGLAYAQPVSGFQVPASGTIQTLTDVGSFPQSQGNGQFFNGATITNNSTAGVGGGGKKGGKLVLGGKLVSS